MFSFFSKPAPAPAESVDGPEAYPSDSGYSTTVFVGRTGAEEQLEGLLRLTLVNLVLIILATLFFIVSWVPGVNWFFLDFFNGSPEAGQNVGVVSGDLTSTTVDSLGWNGAAFTWVDVEEADVACAGPLITSDVCVGLQHKIRAYEIYSFLIVLSLSALLPALAFNSWLVHMLRFGLVAQTQDKATIGYYGCVTSSSTWWLDPCTYILLSAVAFLPDLLIGLPAYPIAIALARDNFVGLGGLWWGGGQTIFGVQAVLSLYAGYELFAFGMLLLLAIMVVTYRQRDAYRAIVYGGGVDASEDLTKAMGESFTEGLQSRVRSMTGVLNYVPTFQWGATGPPADSSSTPAEPQQQQQQQQQQDGNRDYSKSTLDAMIPTDAEFGVSPFADDGSALMMSSGTGKQGGELPQQEAQVPGGVDEVSAFAPSKSFAI